MARKLSSTCCSNQFFSTAACERFAPQTISDMYKKIISIHFIDCIPRKPACNRHIFYWFVCSSWVVDSKPHKSFRLLLKCSKLKLSNWKWNATVSLAAEYVCYLNCISSNRISISIAIVSKTIFQSKCNGKRLSAILHLHWYEIAYNDKDYQIKWYEN